MDAIQPETRSTWSVADAAELEDLDGWIVEADLDLESLELRNGQQACTFRAVRAHHEEARVRELPLGRERTVPAYVWEITVRPADELSIRCEEGYEVLFVKGVQGSGSELRILAANGTLTIRGAALVVSARLERRHELDLMERVWPWFTLGRWRPRRTP